MSRCSVLNATQLQEQVNGVSCISDAKAQACADAFKEAPCTGVPAGCDQFAVADPAPALAACQKFIDTDCSRAMRCTPALTADACQAQSAASIDCSKAVGVKLSFEQCLSELGALSCQATTGPAVCNGALVLGR